MTMKLGFQIALLSWFLRFNIVLYFVMKTLRHQKRFRAK